MSWKANVSPIAGLNPIALHQCVFRGCLGIGPNPIALHKCVFRGCLGVDDLIRRLRRTARARCVDAHNDVDPHAYRRSDDLSGTFRTTSIRPEAEWRNIVLEHYCVWHVFAEKQVYTDRPRPHESKMWTEIAAKRLLKQCTAATRTDLRRLTDHQLHKRQPARARSSLTVPHRDNQRRLDCP